MWRRQWHPTPVLLPGKSHGWRSLVGCGPWGHWGSDTTEPLHFHFSLSCTGEGNGNPLQCSCLENPRDGGVWWVAIYGSHRVGHDWSDLAAAAAVAAANYDILPRRKCYLLATNDSNSLSFEVDLLANSPLPCPNQKWQNFTTECWEKKLLNICLEKNLMSIHAKINIPITIWKYFWISISKYLYETGRETHKYLFIVTENS